MRTVALLICVFEAFSFDDGFRCDWLVKKYKLDISQHLLYLKIYLLVVVFAVILFDDSDDCNFKWYYS